MDVPVPQVFSQEQISERILEQIAETQGSHGIPQERVSERIVEQIVPVLYSLPAERISERIQKQTVDVTSPLPIPQERISERIAEPNVEVDPGPAGWRHFMLVSCHAGRCGVPGRWGFSHFSPEEKKCENRPGVECELGVALELMATGGLSGGGGRVLLLRLREQGVEGGA